MKTFRILSVILKNAGSFMQHRLGQIWQFGLGCTLSAVGATAIVVMVGLNSIEPQLPLLNELQQISGTLISRIQIIDPPKGKSGGKAVWASFALNTAEGTIYARINYPYLLLGYDKAHARLTLVPGDRITAWFSKKDLVDHTQAVTWQMQHDGIMLFTLKQSLAAHYEFEKRSAYLPVGILIVGAAMSFWGWCIYRRRTSTDSAHDTR
jgi:hypothetical protein